MKGFVVINGRTAMRWRFMPVKHHDNSNLAAPRPLPDTAAGLPGERYATRSPGPFSPDKGMPRRVSDMTEAFQFRARVRAASRADSAGFQVPGSLSRRGVVSCVQYRRSKLPNTGKSRDAFCRAGTKLSGHQNSPMFAGLSGPTKRLPRSLRRSRAVTNERRSDGSPTNKSRRSPLCLPSSTRFSNGSEAA